MYKIITFDMFSAVLNIEGTAAPIVKEIVPQLDDDSALSFFRIWRTKQWDYVLLTGHMKAEFVSYEYLTEKALHYACQKCNLTLTETQQNGLMNIWFSFNPWPDAKETLDKLKEKGYTVAMLSNGDTNMLEAISKHCGIEFDYIFSAEKAKAYKPRKEIYEQVLSHFNISKEEHLHVAGSMFDTMGAKAAGFHCCWSNRYNDYLLDDTYAPDYTISNLSELLNIL